MLPTKTVEVPIKLAVAALPGVMITTGAVP
jgi:hypothetical protein